MESDPVGCSFDEVERAAAQDSIYRVRLSLSVACGGLRGNETSELPMQGRFSMAHWPARCRRSTIRRWGPGQGNKAGSRLVRPGNLRGLPRSCKSLEAGKVMMLCQSLTEIEHRCAAFLRPWRSRSDAGPQDGALHRPETRPGIGQKRVLV